jgi:hypothetical protein
LVGVEPFQQVAALAFQLAGFCCGAKPSQHANSFCGSLTLAEPEAGQSE